MSVQLRGFNEAQALMHKLPEEIQVRACKRALKLAAEIVVKAAKSKAPSSRMMGLKGSFYKQSKKQQAESPIPLMSTITFRSKSYKDGVDLVVVGPAYPAGAHGHLVEHGHKAVYWGRMSGGMTSRTLHTPRKQAHQRNMPFVVKTHYTGGARVEGKEFLAPAADQTKKQQEEVFIATLQRAIKRVEREALKKAVG